MYLAKTVAYIYRTENKANLARNYRNSRREG
jgi:hypothetical protein